MAKRTATIQRYHVYGTPNHCLAMFYRDKEITPRRVAWSLPDWIPDDAAGIEQMRQHAKALGFTHVRFTGWRNNPKNGKL